MHLRHDVYLLFKRCFSFFGLIALCFQDLVGGEELDIEGSVLGVGHVVKFSY